MSARALVIGKGNTAVKNYSMGIVRIEPIHNRGSRRNVNIINRIECGIMLYSENQLSNKELAPLDEPLSLSLLSL